MTQLTTKIELYANKEVDFLKDVRHIDVTTSIIDSANGSSDYYEGYVLLGAASGDLAISFDSFVTGGNNFFGYKLIE